jgi:hypothetical protein
MLVWKNDVPTKEINDAFYRSYGEGTPGGLSPKLTDPVDGGRRKLTLDKKDQQLRDCWLEVRRLLRKAKGVQPPPVGSPVGSAMIPCAAPGKLPDSPPYEPALWNDGALGAVQRSTNCYAYAMNSRLGHTYDEKPQPGEKAGVSFNEPVDCKSVTAAVLNDGKPKAIAQAPRCPYNQQQQVPPPQKKGFYLVALVETSKPTGYDAVDHCFYGNDYHWYRQDDDGTWSHKPGWGEVRNVDASNKAITNPETASRRAKVGMKYSKIEGKNLPYYIDYDVFCGYFYVEKGGAPVGP